MGTLLSVANRGYQFLMDGAAQQSGSFLKKTHIIMMPEILHKMGKLP
jgi:hypothetical protein